MLSLLDLINKTTAFLEQKGIENPRLNAELLFAHVLDCKRLDLYLQHDRPLPDGVLDKIRPLVRRRAQREPIQYVLGETDFRNLKLAVDRRALIPRPETEELVGIVIVELTGQENPRILDLGTGSGAIALALAQEMPKASIEAVDASEDALELARENAERNGLAGRVRFYKSDWFSEVEGRFDAVVSNPPYLTAGEIGTAEPEVREFEPLSALQGGGDGLDDIRRILEGAPGHLAPGGLIALETGIAQHAEIAKNAEAQGFADFKSLDDLSGRPRLVTARRS